MTPSRHGRVFLQRCTRHWHPDIQPSSESRSGKGPAEIEPLSEVASTRLQEVKLLFRFNSFADNLQAQTVRHGNDRFDDRCITGFVRDFPDKGFIDL